MSAFIVRNRNRILAGMVMLGIICVCLIPLVKINYDMTAYLPASSPMKQGIDIMKEEFGGLSMDNTVRVMFTDLPEDEKETVYETLLGIENVSSVDYSSGSEDYNKDGRTLYIIHSPYDFHSQEMKGIASELLSHYGNYCGMMYHLDSSTTDSLPLPIVLAALVIILAVLFIMSPSYVEPVLYMAVIGLAVAINTGTNYFLGSVSMTTHSIGALLQLVLSMDYSVMVMEQYRQAKTEGVENLDAMASALSLSFRPVLGSSVTTIAGLLMLVFMSFRIGADLGIVLAKGVLISLFCVFTVMPSLVLASDSLISRSRKPVPRFPSGILGSFSWRFRKGIVLLFLVLLGLVLYLKGNTEITYTMPTPTEIDRYFSKVNQVVVLYSNEDEEKASEIAETAGKTEGVRSAITWAGTIGRPYTAEELTGMLSSFGMDSTFEGFLEEMSLPISEEDALGMLMDMCNLANGRERGSGVTITELLDYILNGLGENPVYGSFLTDDMRGTIEGFQDMLKEAEGSLVGEEHSLMVFTTVLPDESPDTMQFIQKLDESCRESFTGDYYLIGSSPMAYEMSKTFQEELDRISILTAAAVFVVVLLTFRKLFLSVLLVALIQTAVYITVVVMGLQGQSMYYLAFLMVQSILMGATIDYAIVFTNYYREGRKSESIRDAAESAYRNSFRTILTSGLIIIIATVILGYAFEDPSIGQICHTIAKGTSAALVLIIFVLPGMLCALDRLVLNKDKKGTR